MVDDVCGFPAFSNGLTNANSTNLTEFVSWAQVLVSIHDVLGSICSSIMCPNGGGGDIPHSSGVSYSSS